MKIKSLLALGCGIMFASVALAGGSLTSSDDSGEITFVKNNKRVPDKMYQAQLRQAPAWQNFLAAHGTWYVQFDEDNAKPHRAYGTPIPTVGTDGESRALWFINNYLADFNVPTSELEVQTVNRTSKHTNVIFHQKHQGTDILWSRMYVKLANNGDVIMFGADVFSDLSSLSLVPAISEAAAMSAAEQNLMDPVTGTTIKTDKFILPIPGNKEYTYRLVYQVEVNTQGEDNIPGRYLTYVDADNGDVLYRQNEVVNFCTHGHGEVGEEHACDASSAMPPPITLTLEGTLTLNPTRPTVVSGIGNCEVDISGTLHNTDANGNLTLTNNSPVTATFALRGLYSEIFSGTNGGSSPSYTTTLNPGSVTESWDGNANATEISAYQGVNVIHDYMKTWTEPGFTALDYPLETRVDRTDGNCNAFYNGSSINFYATANGCDASAYFDDIIYHEYGHGINNDYYQYFGGFFGNGSLGEGYADVWALAVTQVPILGEGFSGPNTDVRRYDINPKVYPQDLTGEVHANGEIICGAWYDLGQEITTPTMMDIFVNTYPAVLTAAAGNEGELFTDVLLEALFYDDNDADITNGTPNGIAITVNFDKHGITLLSNATVAHADLTWEAPIQDINIEADLTLQGPFTYFNSLSCFYTLNDDPTVNQLTMTLQSGSTYAANIPGQPFGTVIGYYIGAEDIFGNISSVVPFAADEAEEPNIPYFIMVGYTPHLYEDLDFNGDLGNWDVGLNSDNATTGEWEINIPLGSFGDVNDPSTMVAPDHQHTPNGELAFITGRANTVSDALGANDVDAGTTTLQSSPIDLTGYTNPSLTYWRWYTNNPPSGANPFADWWQVALSDDGGNTWVNVEDTRRSDRSWRRFAFRVQDYVSITNQFMIKFNVSDSLRPGQNLDGGSLVEGALDDITLWDNADPDNVDELQAIAAYTIYPNPATDMTSAAFQLPEAGDVEMIVFNTIGEELMRKDLGYLSTGSHQTEIDVKTLAEGVYMVTLSSNGHRFVRRLTVVK
jgi:hypothetical protein